MAVRIKANRDTKKPDIFHKVSDDSDYKFWIIDKETYDNYRKYEKDNSYLVQKVSDLETMVKNLKASSEKDKAFILDHKAQIEQKLADAEAYRAESEENKKTIDKVIEVCRERANKSRGFKNKKNNPGYEVLRSEKIFYKTSKTQGVMLWQTTIQLPFFTEFDISEVANFWNEDNYRYTFFRDIHIGNYEETDLGYYDLNKVIDNECYLKVDFIKNFKTGYWEARLLHTSEVIL